MIYHLGVEDIEPGKWLAWAFELLGCYAKAASEEEAFAGAQAAIEEYFFWVARHGRPTPRADQPIEGKVVETYRSFVSEGDYIVNAFFEDDRRPLSGAEVGEGIWLLGCTRRDLMELIRDIPPERFTEPIRDDVFGSIEKIVEHVATAEWWYFDRLGMAFPRDQMPEGLAGKLEKVRAQTVALLPALVDDSRVVERRGEKCAGVGHRDAPRRVRQSSRAGAPGLPGGERGLCWMPAQDCEKWIVRMVRYGEEKD